MPESIKPVDFDRAQVQLLVKIDPHNGGEVCTFPLKHARTLEKAGKAAILSVIKAGAEEAPSLEDLYAESAALDAKVQAKQDATSRKVPMGPVGNPGAGKPLSQVRLGKGKRVGKRVGK